MSKRKASPTPIHGTINRIVSDLEDIALSVSNLESEAPETAAEIIAKVNALKTVARTIPLKTKPAKTITDLRSAMMSAATAFTDAVEAHLVSVGPKTYKLPFDIDCTDVGLVQKVKVTNAGVYLVTDKGESQPAADVPLLSLSHVLEVLHHYSLTQEASLTIKLP